MGFNSGFKGLSEYVQMNIIALFIHIKIQQDTTMYQNLIHIYIKLNMFWATHRPSSGA